MKSDIIVKQFIDLLGHRIDNTMQNYLDGKNEWQRPIMESDIIKLQYGFSTVHGEAARRKYSTTGILLLHKIPDIV